MDCKELKLVIVVPCLNEEEGLNGTIEKLKNVLSSLVTEREISSESFIYLVDDGSTDNTWAVVESAHNLCPSMVKGVKLTRNFGNQCAILAGLKNAKDFDPDAVITIDADLQQDETKIKDFIQKYKEGADVVFGVRKDRKTDGLIKKTTARMFYKFMQYMGVKLVPNHSEYRLMGRHALEMLDKYNEKNIFLRGIFANMGLKTAEVPFDVKERSFGTTKFNMFSLMKLASWGITSFSITPLRLIFYVGVIISFLGFTLGIICIWNFFMPSFILFNNFRIRFFEVYQVFASGIQVLSIGIIGEYIGQILQEVKNRPNFLIDKKLD